MHSYTVSQWLLFFYVYGLCGWVWESCITSICQKGWVNRGVLHGPLLPIYGFGAILILMSTLSVRGCWWGIALLGALSATMLEYGTNTVIERILKVKYWNYKNKWNLHGRICASSTVVWGVFSVLLVQTMHPWMDEQLRQLPAFIVIPLVVVVTGIAVVDFMVSIRDARTLQALLNQITEENEQLRYLMKRIETVAGFSEEDLQTFRQKTDLERDAFDEEGTAHWKQWKEKQSRKFRNRHKQWELNLEQRLEAKRQAVETLMEEIELFRPQLEEWFAKDSGGKHFSDTLEELHHCYARLRMASPKHYQSTYRMLRRNPTAYTELYQEALEVVSRLGEEEQ